MNNETKRWVQEYYSYLRHGHPEYPGNAGSTVLYLLLCLITLCVMVAAYMHFDLSQWMSTAFKMVIVGHVLVALGYLTVMVFEAVIFVRLQRLGYFDI